MQKSRIGAIAFMGLTLFAGVDSEADEGGYFSRATIAIQEAAFDVSGGLIAVDALGGGRYLACFEMAAHSDGTEDLSFLLIDAVKRELVTTFEVERTGSYEVRVTGSGKYFTIIAGDETANSYVYSLEGELLVSVSGGGGAVALVVADPGLIGLSYYSPQFRGASLPGSNLRYELLPSPGPFSECEWGLESYQAGVIYLSRELVVVSYVVDGEQIAAGILPGCGKIWELAVPPLSHPVGLGSLGGGLAAVMNSSAGGFVLDLQSGARSPLCGGVEFVTLSAFTGGRLFLPCMKGTVGAAGTAEFELKCIENVHGEGAALPLYEGLRPSILDVSEGMLVCQYTGVGPGMIPETVIYSQDNFSGVVLDGIWRPYGMGEIGLLVVGGRKGQGNLLFGEVE
jgi:hypothetical protein